jgi:xanthine dehydrogenase accessory factor
VGTVFHCDERYEQGVPDLDPECYVAVVTRCHRTDRLALRYALGRHDLRYVGLIGSRRKRKVIFEDLAAAVPQERLARVHCPIGLRLGGDTPAEIAVSIVAQLLQERHRTSD